MSREIGIVLQLGSIEELFVAPAANPFSTHAVDILGQTGLTIVQSRVTQSWPRRPRKVHLTVQLPSEQISPDLVPRTRAAVQRHCTKKIENNRVQRQLAVRNALRQLVGALVGILLVLALIALLVADPLGLLPDFLRGVLIVLALYACSVLSFDALWSLAFDWVPFVQENTVYRAIEGIEITIEPVPGIVTSEPGLPTSPFSPAN